MSDFEILTRALITAVIMLVMGLFMTANNDEYKTLTHFWKMFNDFGLFILNLSVVAIFSILIAMVWVY